MLKRLLIIYIALLAPLVLYNASKWGKLKKLHKQHTSLETLNNQAFNFSQIEASNRATKDLYKGASSSYLYTELESFPLSNNHQNIQLIESPAYENAFYIEKDENLAHLVQVDLKDLRSLLKIVEGEAGGASKKPHLIFTELSMKKNKNSENILYDLNFKLIKREYLK